MREQAKGKTAAALGEALLLLLFLQGSRLLLERAICPLLPDETFWRRMATAAVMVLLAAAVCTYARLRRTPLSVFPKPFGRRYILLTCAVVALLISAPSNFTGGYQAVLLAVYGSIVTPVYEELLFRGYLWNRLGQVMRNESGVYLWSVVLFTLWHLGYMTAPIMEGNWTAVAWKLAAGVGYGAVLGFVRLKTKNCYATMLAHGVLNIFMI